MNVFTIHNSLNLKGISYGTNCKTLILGNLSEQSHKPRKKYNSFPFKNIKLLVFTPPSFIAHAHFRCFNLQQYSFNLQKLVLKIWSNYFKFAAALFNLQQLCFICSNFILFATILLHLQQRFLICSMSLVGHHK